MSRMSKRSTIYFDPKLLEALRQKAEHSDRTLSELVNEAVRTALEEDREDLGAFEERSSEPILSYEELIHDLKVHGKL